jgi:CRP-like cAMP-binding protein
MIDFAFSEIFLKLGKMVHLRKKENFSKQNEFSNSIGFIQKGSVKLVYKIGKKQWIKSFIFENGIVGSLPSILEKKPSSYFIQAMEETEVLILNGTSLFKKYESDLNFLKYMNHFLANLYLKKEARVSDFLLLTHLTQK